MQHTNMQTLSIQIDKLHRAHHHRQCCHLYVNEDAGAPFMSSRRDDRGDREGKMTGVEEGRTLAANKACLSQH